MKGRAIIVDHDKQTEMLHEEVGRLTGMNTILLEACKEAYNQLNEVHCLIENDTDKNTNSIVIKIVDSAINQSEGG